MATNMFCILLLLLLSCNINNSQKQLYNKVEMVAYVDSLEFFSRQWKNDSLGCDKIRSIKMFERLLNGYDLEKKNEMEFLNVLGTYNEEEKYTDKMILIYYFNSICNANKIVSQSDKSSVRIIFDYQKQYKGYDTRIE